MSTYSVKSELKPSNLTGISAKQIDEHWALYEGYIKQSNALRQQLDDMRAKGEGEAALYEDRRRRFAFEYAGMVMHEYYFANLKAEQSQESAPSFVEAVTNRFGSFDAWAQDFKKTGTSRGIGWAVTLMDPLTGDINNHFIEEHAMGMLAGYHPLLMMDVWEHAYLFDVGATERGKHIGAFMDNINWPVVEERLKTAQSGHASARAGGAAAQAA